MADLFGQETATATRSSGYEKRAEWPLRGSGRWVDRASWDQEVEAVQSRLCQQGEHDEAQAFGERAEREWDRRAVRWSPVTGKPWSPRKVKRGGLR